MHISYDRNWLVIKSFNELLEVWYQFSNAWLRKLLPCKILTYIKVIVVVYIYISQYASKPRCGYAN